MRECKVHPKFLEAKSIRDLDRSPNDKWLKCEKCRTFLLTKRSEKVKVGNLPEVKTKFNISKNDLKHNIKDGKWNGYPDEFYIGKNITLFKHGDTMKIIKKNISGIAWEDFTPLWVALLKQHKGDEDIQFFFMRNNLNKLKLGVSK